MDEKFNQGLADQAMAEFENIKNLRIEFIQCKTDKRHIEILEEAMNNLYEIYLSLTRTDGK